MDHFGPMTHPPSSPPDRRGGADLAAEADRAGGPTR